MWFWWFMFICDLIVPIIMIIGGYFMEKHPPKNINGIIGYRTPRSRKNKETWDFAHKYCGRLWRKTGTPVLAASIAVHVPIYHASEDKISLVGCILMTIQIAVLLFCVYSTEKALKKTFDDNGKRR